MINITSIKEKNILSSDREEALKFIKQWKQELIMMSSFDNAENVINTICKALEAKEPSDDKMRIIIMIRNKEMVNITASDNIKEHFIKGGIINIKCGGYDGNVIKDGE